MSSGERNVRYVFWYLLLRDLTNGKISRTLNPGQRHIPREFGEHFRCRRGEPFLREQDFGRLDVSQTRLRNVS